MTASKCRKTVHDSLVKVCEGRRSAVVRNSARESYMVTKVDGCLLHNVVAADWVISKEGFGDLIIELKGVDVSHAFEQVYATAEYWISETSFGNGKLAGLIVCRQSPRETSSIQRKKRKFFKRFRSSMHVETKNTQYDFPDLFLKK